jgi:hypothetical protein
MEQINDQPSGEEEVDSSEVGINFFFFLLFFHLLRYLGLGLAKIALGVAPVSLVLSLFFLLWSLISFNAWPDIATLLFVIISEVAIGIVIWKTRFLNSYQLI